MRLDFKKYIYEQDKIFSEWNIFFVDATIKFTIFYSL